MDLCRGRLQDEDIRGEVVQQGGDVGQEVGVGEVQVLPRKHRVALVDPVEVPY
jgi:hypothetical protein